MSHFLLVYDRSAGQLVRMEKFASSPEALRARFQTEAEFSARSDIEVVAVAAQSEEDLRRTHGRYFLGLDDLAARLA